MPDEPEFPILYLDREVGGKPEKLSGGPSEMRHPPREEQRERLDVRFRNLTRSTASERGQIVDGVVATAPEQVVVFEVATDVEDFYASVRNIAGMEFLLGLADGEGQADEIFAARDESGDIQAPGVPVTVLLTLSNRAAVSEVLRLWDLYSDPDRPRFPRGLGAWRQLFDLLVDVRPWSPEDRIRATGIREDLAARLAVSDAAIRAELDLWCRASDVARRQAADDATAAVLESGGEVVAQAVVAEISYHSLLVEFPASVARSLLEQGAAVVPFLTSQVVAFLRPQAQAASTLNQFDDGEDEEGTTGLGAGSTSLPGSIEAPVVAVLDGVPQLDHAAIAGRVIFDDPEDFQSEYLVRDRQHGTAVVSAVLNGDLSSRRPTDHTAYVRPILRPSIDRQGNRVEAFPSDQLPVDLLYRAVIRMVDGPSAVAPSVKVVNLSIGDASNVFNTIVSPLARLLDFLAHKYSLLFVVSSGNHMGPMTLGSEESIWKALGAADARAESLAAMSRAALVKRLLSPSEAINVLTVGASHDDDSAVAASGGRVDPLPGSGVGLDAAPSPLSAMGDGFNRSVKPDVCAPGGRLFFRPLPVAAGEPMTLSPRHSQMSGPGVRVAAPGASGSQEIFEVGTSIAAGIASSFAADIVRRLQGGGSVPDEFQALATKALLVHGCSWGEGGGEVISAWPHPVPAAQRRAVASRFFGYGILDGNDRFAGEASRVTLVNYGLVHPGRSVKLRVPLPPSLSGKVGERTIAMTLASWLPTESTHKAHRAARVYFRPISTPHRISRVGADWHSVMNGSVQHEVLTGTSAIPYQAGDTFDFSVSCRPVPEKRVGVDPVPYVVFFTLRTAVQIPVHAEVRQSLRARIQGRVRAIG